MLTEEHAGHFKARDKSDLKKIDNQNLETRCGLGFFGGIIMNQELELARKCNHYL